MGRLVNIPCHARPGTALSPDAPTTLRTRLDKSPPLVWNRPIGRSEQTGLPIASGDPGAAIAAEKSDYGEVGNMKEILPGIFHWTQTHPKINIPVSSYYLRPEGVLFDPLVPDEGLEWFADDPPKNIYMSIRHHYRHCGEISERYGCDVWCAEQGMHEFTKGEVVRPFSFGEILPGNIKAIEIGSLCPDEGAFFIDREGGCMVLADGCVRRGDGPLQFVPDQLLGDDPAAVKAGLVAAYSRLLEDYSFSSLLLAHGKPIVGDGRVALEKFIAS